MLLRVKNKQLTNVSVITLKRGDKKFEVAVYPNKLYEYKHDPSVLLSTIIHSEIIYKNISKGDICPESDLLILQDLVFNKENSHTKLNKIALIHYILSNGHEQKAIETSSYELETIEKQILEMVQGKVMYNGRYMTSSILLDFIKKVWNIKNMDPKKQVSGIIKKLEEIGFERVTFKLKADITDLNGFYEYYKLVNDEAIEDTSVVYLQDGHVVVRSDILPDIIDYCEENNMKYVINKNDDFIEEDIC